MVLSQAYPDGSAVMRGLQPFKVSGRDPFLQSFYEHDSPHPCYSLKFPNSQTFICLVDPLAKAKNLFIAISNAQRVLSGMIKGMYKTVD